jgi:hypothetical protein
MASSGAGYGQGEPSLPPALHASQPMSAESSNASRNYGTLSPPNISRTLSISPGEVSDMSNEAVGGHSGNPSSMADYHIPSRPMHSHNNSTSTQASRVLRGFEAEHSNMPTPIPNADTAETEVFFPKQQDRTNGATSTVTSGTTTAVNESSSNGFSTQNANQSVGDYSQLTTASSTAAFEEVIPTTFDEATLRTLCDMDVSSSK